MWQARTRVVVEEFQAAGRDFAVTSVHRGHDTPQPITRDGMEAICAHPLSELPSCVPQEIRGVGSGETYLPTRLPGLLGDSWRQAECYERVRKRGCAHSASRNMLTQRLSCQSPEGPRFQSAGPLGCRLGTDHRDQDQGTHPGLATRLAHNWSRCPVAPQGPVPPRR
jgi:hypothetical protein